MFKQISFFVLSFAFPFALRYAFADQNAVFYACKGEKSSYQNAVVIDCNSANSVIDAIQKQFAFLVNSRGGNVYDYECGREYAYARRMKEENLSALQKRAPQSLAICNDAIAQTKK
jgi:hypothetical protein